MKESRREYFLLIIFLERSKFPSLNFRPILFSCDHKKETRAMIMDGGLQPPSPTNECTSGVLVLSVKPNEGIVQAPDFEIGS